MIEYDPHLWRKSMALRGTMIWPIFSRALPLTLLATAITVAHFFWHPLGVSGDVHNLVGLAMSMLLVFRTNASYDRFWEGRKLWGSVVNHSRNLARLTAVHFARDPSMRSEILQLLAQFPHSSMVELRDKVGAKTHRPTQVTLELARALNRGREKGLISDLIYFNMTESVQVLSDAHGACERIHKTPLPFAYVVHLRRALIIYCSTLPFALLDRFGWATIGITLLVNFVLLGIEEIGVEIEDPFGVDPNDLPLENICNSIAKQMRALDVDSPAEG